MPSILGGGEVMAHALVAGTEIGTGDGVSVGEKVGVSVGVGVSVDVEVGESDDAGAGVVVDGGASPVVEDMDDDVGARVAEGVDDGAGAEVTELVAVEEVAHELARAIAPRVAPPTNSTASFRNSLRENPFFSSGSFLYGITSGMTERDLVSILAFLIIASSVVSLLSLAPSPAILSSVRLFSIVQMLNAVKYIYI